jgi:hypothetical protein
MARKFYKTVVKVEILTEDPIEFDNLCDLDYQINHDACGVIKSTVSKQISGRACARAMIAQDRDPSFFQLTNAGRDE